MRKEGDKNLNHERKKKKLLEKLVQSVIKKGTQAASFRQLAKETRVQVNTLQHYFNTKEELMESIFAEVHEQGKEHIQDALNLSQKNPKDAFRIFLSNISNAWFMGILSPIHELGLSIGLENSNLGMSYINHLLEPTLQSLEGLIDELIKLKKIQIRGDVRSAALSLLSPVFLALLHQKTLGGAICRKLDMEAFIELHITLFLSGWEINKSKR